jgi:Arc/MetJ-type ribon-helix-helix transcriptional regulator
MVTNKQKPTRNAEHLQERPDMRITIRFRHHCDEDLIAVLEQVPNKNEFIREALREALQTRAERQDGE